jgi:hypothetical protein
VVNVADAQILTIPGEALPNIGYYLKRKMHGKHNLLFGLTNDALGYIMVKEDFDSFERYEYITRTCLGEMTGEIFIDQALKFVDACPAGSRCHPSGPSEQTSHLDRRPPHRLLRHVSLGSRTPGKTATRGSSMDAVPYKTKK